MAKNYFRMFKKNMKINNYTTSITSFQAKNKNIRKADDIRRKANDTFPMISPTYVDEFYISSQPSNQTQRNQQVKNISTKFQKKINTLRELIKSEEANNNITDPHSVTPYTLHLNGIKFLKMGNCKEAAISALAALCANGYYDSKRALLYLKTEYINKLTGEVEYEAFDPLDHSFVITTMDKKSLHEAKEKDIIIVDPWMGFTDSVSGAKARFKQIYDKDSFREIESFRRSMFRLEKAMQGCNDLNFDNYELKHTFTFREADTYTKEQLENLGLYSRIMYSDLIKKPQSTHANA